MRLTPPNSIRCALPGSPASPASKSGGGEVPGASCVQPVPSCQVSWKTVPLAV
jgi:hypothetical protein